MDSGELLAFLAKRQGPAGRGLRHRRGAPAPPRAGGTSGGDQGPGLPHQAGHQRQPPPAPGQAVGAGAGGLCGHGHQKLPRSGTARPQGSPAWTWGPSGRACPGCWRAVWTMSSAPPWCGSSTTAPPSGPSAPGSPGARRYFLQAFVDRDTVLRPGLTRLVPGGDGGVRRSGPPLGPGSGAAGHLNRPPRFWLIWQCTRTRGARVFFVRNNRSICRFFTKYVSCSYYIRLQANKILCYTLEYAQILTSHFLHGIGAVAAAKPPRD